MKKFMDKDFLLTTDTAKELYFNYAKELPIFDFHNHLSAEEIYKDFCYDNLSQIWLDYDHYKWRAMRAMGVDEKYLTRREDDYKRYLEYVRTIEQAIGNPLYHWTHLELQRCFQIDQVLTLESAEEIWEEANKKLRTREYSIRNLLKMQKVVKMCTTDDPIDDLYYHRELQKENIDVRPTFRPDKAINIEDEGFADYISQLARISENEITDMKSLIESLINRLDYFISVGCLVSDHSLEKNIYKDASSEEVDDIFARRMQGATISEDDCSKYRGAILIALGKAYAKQDIVMQLHIGTIRDNSKILLEKGGKNIGGDSLHDFNYAPELNGILRGIEECERLPKTILYCLNPKDTTMLATVCGNFQGSSGGGMQLGTAWWFNDNIPGMKAQMEIFASQGVFGKFIGMLTDSRSYLSFSRHEYFRRLLCNMLGQWMEDGEYPNDIPKIGIMVQNICYHNAIEFFD